MYLIKNNFTGEESKMNNTKGIPKKILKDLNIDLKVGQEEKRLISALKDRGRFKLGIGKLSITILNLKLRNEDGTLKKKAK